MSLKPGTYEAVIDNYGMGETKSGLPKVWIKFRVNDEEKNNAFWEGYLHNEKSLEILVKNLITMGFSGTDITLLTDGKSSGALDVNKVLELVIENENYNGKDYSKVKWINTPGGKGFTKEEAVAKTQGYNFAGAMLKAQQEMGISNESTGKNSQPSQTIPTPGHNAEEAPPF